MHCVPIFELAGHEKNFMERVPYDDSTKGDRLRYVAFKQHSR
jgi:hypothetical protein